MLLPGLVNCHAHMSAVVARGFNELGWHWWELWHHEGRRARHGAAMMGPDYTEFGAGFAEGSGMLTLYWTQTFGRPAGS